MNWIQKIKLKIKQHFCKHNVTGTVYYRDADDRPAIVSKTTCERCKKHVRHPMPDKEIERHVYMLNNGIKEPYCEKIGFF